MASRSRSPTVRRSRLDDGREITLTDTVGFVRHLPHQLIEAFRSTLEEAAEADLLLHVVDAAHADPGAQVAAVRAVLADLDLRDVPEIVVLNKADAADPDVLAALCRRESHHIVVSARTGEGIDELRALIERELPLPAHEVMLVVPYDRGDVVALLHRRGRVLLEEHEGDGTHLTVRIGPELLGSVDPFVVSTSPGVSS